MIQQIANAMTKTIESLDGTVYEIQVDGDDIILMAPDHTLLLHGASLDPENIERYIDDNFDLAKRIEHPYEGAKESLFDQLVELTKPNF